MIPVGSREEGNDKKWNMNIVNVCDVDRRLKVKHTVIIYGTPVRLRANINHES